MPRRSSRSPASSPSPQPFNGELRAGEPDSSIAPALIDWYDRARRRLPWRAEPGASADPYHVWLSEMMLQQTTVATVIPYFLAFTRRWPEIGALAAAARDDVLAAWAGLGYYARARNLHDAARAIVERHDRRFPDDEAALRALPGIGAYTAAAIAAIAFGRRAVVVDGNVERVIARLFAIDAPMPGAKPMIRAAADRLTPSARPGDYAQAMMDLGATICTPRKPACGLCPVMTACRARIEGDPEAFPVKATKRAKPQRHGVAYWLEDARGRVLLTRRPETGLLGGMLALPTGAWTDTPPEPARIRDEAPVPAFWQLIPGSVRHVFTHFALDLRVARARLAPGDPLADDPAVGLWTARSAVLGAGLPTLFARAARHAFADAP